VPRNPIDEDDDAGSDEKTRGEAYIEFKQVGQAMKVTAVDAETGIEVVIMGPASASRNDLQRVALQKLKAQIKKAKDPVPPDPSDPEDNGGGSGSKGWIA